MQDPKVLTIILNYRTPELSLRSLDAAYGAMEGIAGEILVVDNCSGDGSCEVIAKGIEARGWAGGSRVRLAASGHNGGFGAGNNFGMKLGLSDGSQPDYIYLLNSDAFPEKSAISELFTHLAAHPKAGMAGSYIRGEDEIPHITAFRFPSVAGEFEGAVRTGIVTRLLKGSVVPLPMPQEATSVDWVAGASVLMRREMLDEIGGFDERFFLYFEETDLCRRARRAGWEVWYLPQSRVVHLGSVSTGMKTWARTPGYWFDSRLHYFVKNHGRGYAVGATLARVAGAALWRLRVAVSGKELGDPPHFLRDLIGHGITSVFRRQSDSGPEAGVPLREEGK
ncbi:glycosyltransferase family 2 protein [Roseovarius sp. C7]|uniref:glycosyltransferase family 2 protein n=1 Tax=Roseovarius sp. C7 TaxID=3398643 RepID=UPI0039F52A99